MLLTLLFKHHIFILTRLINNMFQKKSGTFSCKTTPTNKNAFSVHCKRRKAQIFISFIVGTGIFLSVCFAAAMLVSNTSPVIINDLDKQKEDLSFFSFTHRVMGNISEGETLIEESRDLLSDCTLLDMNDPNSINNHTYIKKIFEIENAYNIELNEHPVAVTTTPSGSSGDYTGIFVIEGKTITVIVKGLAYTQVFLDDGGIPEGPFAKGGETDAFTDKPIYVEKIDEEGQFVIFKKQLVNCGNYPDKYALFQETNRYLVSEDKNIISVKLSLW